MGTDNLFHKRKLSKKRSVRKKRNLRDPYKKILIVSEGKKTEPHYFTGLRDYYALNTANVRVTGDSQSAPSKVLDYARQKYREERDMGDAYDMVFCVFDKDTHACYERTKDNILNASPKNTFYAITSVPCFEFWLLLHFVRKDMPYEATGGRSAADNVVKDLKNYLIEYEKNKKDIFREVSHLIDNAIHNSESVLRGAKKHDSDNPSTNAHELVYILKNLNKTETND